jgi:NADP-dependent 3-hydroxy acid dehydrogenase YdfG
MLTILVTGATGNVGQEVIRLLFNQNCQVRAAVRNPDTATQILNIHLTTDFPSRSIDCNPSVWSFIKQMRDRGLPMDFILVMAGIYTTARLGLASHLTPDVEQLLARPPITMRQYVEDYWQCWL